MPSRAQRACRQPGCPALVTTGYCKTHEKPAAQQKERWRGSAASRGYSAGWQRVRVQALKRDKYLCQTCLRIDRVTPAQDVDHIIPIIVEPERRLDLSNLQSLCRPCHRLKGAEDKRRYGQ